MSAGPSPFSHLDETGGAQMVNVVSKAVQRRRAAAQATLHCRAETIDALRRHALPKGDVLVVAKVAAIQAAKRTAELIPLCHTLPLSCVDVRFEVLADRVEIQCVAETLGQTGVEMEALTGAAVAALTVYDMCKAVDKTMRIEGIRVLEKTKQ